MTKRFCDICGELLGRYEIWSVSLNYSNDPAPPIDPRHAADLCETCVAPARDIVMRAHGASS